MSISLEKVSYIYEDNSDIKKPALIDIDLEIGEGEFIGIIGHTGSGKSTLIQHLNGLMEPTKEGCILRERISTMTIMISRASGERSACVFSIRNTSCLRQPYWRMSVSAL